MSPSAIRPVHPSIARDRKMDNEVFANRAELFMRATVSKSHFMTIENLPYSWTFRGCSRLPTRYFLGDNNASAQKERTVTPIHLSVALIRLALEGSIPIVTTTFIPGLRSAAPPFCP